MKANLKNRLNRFYDQVLLMPELFCLHCAHNRWDGKGGRCSTKKRMECLFMVGEIKNSLAMNRVGAQKGLQGESDVIPAP